MKLLQLLTSNYLINVSFVAFMGAQLLKMVFVFLVDGKWVAERMFGAGGMPSSHSALVCALTIGMARKVGFASPMFALTLALAGIVMYDAMGVRRAAGEQAKVINKLVFGFQYLDFTKLFSEPGTDTDESTQEGESGDAMDAVEGEELLTDHKKLKEYLGHTPFEVLGGALFGILVAMVVPVS